MVWPIPFLICMFNALKGSQFYFYSRNHQKKHNAEYSKDIDQQAATEHATLQLTIFGAVTRIWVFPPKTFVQKFKKIKTLNLRTKKWDIHYKDGRFHNKDAALHYAVNVWLCIWGHFS